MDYAIIAAGEGSRLAQEGVKWPKPLVRLNGVALIDRLIDVFLKNNATSISIIVNEEMTEVQDYLKALRLPIPFYLLVKSTPSSMHSFYELSHYLDGDKICLTTVDTIFKEEEFSGYIQQFIQEDKLDGLMAVTDFIDDEKPLYVETDNELYVRNFLDQADGDCRYISGGIYCSGCIEQRHLAGNVENAQLSTAAHRRGVEAKGLSFQQDHRRGSRR